MGSFDFELPEHVEEERIVGRLREKLPTDLCVRCQHERSDHRVENERFHSHFTDYQQIHPRQFKTSCRDPYCHVALCACMIFLGCGEAQVSSFASAWIKENGLLRL